MEKTVSLDGVTLHLGHPDDLPVVWVGREDLLLQVLAAWLMLEPRDLPLHPRLVGKPGVGKTTLAYAAAKRLNRDVYLFQATMDTRPEDLIVSPVIGESGKIQYVASSLVTAMIRGAVCVVDEGNRMSEKSWASLAPLLDARRYVESIVAGVKIHAHRDFRFCATMNDDASTFDLPEYIHSRLMPQILIDFPEPDEEAAILRQNVPFADEQIVAWTVDFLQRAHARDEKYTVRDGVNIVRYAIKLGSRESKLQLPRQEALGRAVRQILGEEAVAHIED
ncbi:MAG: AAA family ATPase [Myxococcales bacterium]|nr:AAA family ATPase [Myxococcales bacterium]